MTDETKKTNTDETTIEEIEAEMQALDAELGFDPKIGVEESLVETQKSQKVLNYTESSIELRIGGTGNQMKIYFYDVSELAEKIDKIANATDMWEQIDQIKERASNK